ncbi:hypothetical protein TNCV_2653251 [Trichonephila clavipes]|nr:hypothetical protein TNCV_2653251 [Trichonephila clavipes]
MQIFFLAALCRHSPWTCSSHNLNHSPRSQSESMFTVPSIQSESKSQLSAKPKLKNFSTPDEETSHKYASRIPSFDQSPSCHSAEWKTPLLPCPAS